MPGDDIFEDKSLRLATLISERNLDSSDDIARYGQEYCFTPSEGLSGADATVDIRKLSECEDTEGLLQAHETVCISNSSPTFFTSLGYFHIRHETSGSW